MRNLVNLTDDEIESAFEDLGVSLSVSEQYGCDVVFTRDTLDDFVNAAANYNEHGRIHRTKTTLVIERAQARKGDSRNDLYVIDFGEVRGAYH